jgi:hypothetical protein
MLQTIWDQLNEIFGPILHPILDPIFAALQNTTVRANLLSTIIWSCLVIGGLVFVVNEAPMFLQLVTGSKAALPRAGTPKTETKASQSQIDTSKLHRISAERSRLELKERENRIQASGVKVTAKTKKLRDTIELKVTVHNGSDSQIDMVVVDIDLPAGIDPAIGSFRMQRLGSIPAGKSETQVFHLNQRGGDISQISGYVEFLGALYEVSKTPLPPIEVVEE